MNIIELKGNKKLNKKTYNNINDLVLNMYYLDFKRRKELSPNEIIKKYKLNKKFTGKKENITNEIDKIAYNL